MPGGLWGVAVLLLVLGLAAVAIKVGVGPIGRASGGERAVFVGKTRSAAEHRARADAAAERADWHAAVIERYRALVRSLEERGLVDERPGRTADEAAAEGAAALPPAADLLRPAARAFDDVAYGGRAADAAAHAPGPRRRGGRPRRPAGDGAPVSLVEGTAATGAAARARPPPRARPGLRAAGPRSSSSWSCWSRWCWAGPPAGAGAATSTPRPSIRPARRRSSRSCGSRGSRSPSRGAPPPRPPAAADGATLLVAIPDLLRGEQVDRLRSLPGDLVLVTPGGPQDWAEAIGQSGTAEVRERTPGCALREAVRAGRADTGGLLYTATEAPGTTAVLCYTDGGRASVLVLDEGDRRIVVLGSADILTNDRFDATGNAALALNLLGRADSLVWYLPVPEAGADGPSLGSLVPDGVRFALIQVALGVILLALWRARRLGRVVAEPLPVEIRASEAVEGRGRLLRRARATDRAALALRTATLARLRGPLGLPRSTDSAADRAAVVAAVAARTGRPQAEVAALLYGGAPADDPALVRLADELDRLDREVRHP